MKTTIVIADPLARRARAYASQQGTTLRALVEDGLMRVLAAPNAAGGYRMPDCAVGESGGFNPLAGLDWREVRDVIYGEASS